MTDTTHATSRLYWDDAYMQKARARVLVNDATLVILDATPFHPHGGVQPGDTGFIGDIKVVDTRKCDDQNTIVHHLERPPEFTAGDEVTAAIDWQRRYALMRHHSLLHVVHLAVQRVAGAVPPGGTQLTEEKARIEYALHDPLDITAVEELVRDMVAQDLPASTAIGEDGTRRWKIPGWPAIPCGGTHVARLSELDWIQLRSKSVGKRGIRVYGTSTLTPFTF